MQFSISHIHLPKTEMKGPGFRGEDQVHFQKL